MIGEMGRDGFLPAFSDINILSHSGADILQHNHADVSLVFRQIGIFHFRKAQSDFRSGLHARQTDTGDSYHILPHVVHKHTGADFFY